MSQIDQAYAHCEELVRKADHDRFLASLFAESRLRRHLMALYAFNLEIASTRERVSDPLPGEMRLQWWRDVLRGEAAGAVDSHPVASALLDTVKTCHLPIDPMVNMVDARVFDLYDDVMPTLSDLEGYAGETCSALIQLAAVILAEGVDPGTGTIAGHAGVSYALCGLVRAFAFHARRGQLFLPADMLAKEGLDRDKALSGEEGLAVRRILVDLRLRARFHLDQVGGFITRIPASVVPAFLPVALVRPALDRLDRCDYPVYAPAPEVPDWRKQWVLWRSARVARKCSC